VVLAAAMVKAQVLQVAGQAQQECFLVVAGAQDIH